MDAASEASLDTDGETILVDGKVWEQGSIYSTLDVRKSQIRVLSISKIACCSKAPVCCDLYKVSLYDGPEFAALSYCWGDSYGTVDICLAGLLVPVTKSLATALQRLSEMP